MHKQTFIAYLSLAPGWYAAWKIIEMILALLADSAEWYSPYKVSEAIARTGCIAALVFLFRIWNPPLLFSDAIKRRLKFMLRKEDLEDLDNWM